VSDKGPLRGGVAGKCLINARTVKVGCGTQVIGHPINQELEPRFVHVDARVASSMTCGNRGGGFLAAAVPCVFIPPPIFWFRYSQKLLQKEN
jgi:hypothetical protein